MKVKEYKYIPLHKDDEVDGTTYPIRNNKTDNCLGWLEWYPVWKQFVFVPSARRVTVWSKSCLDDIMDAIDVATSERK